MVGDATETPTHPNPGQHRDPRRTLPMIAALRFTIVLLPAMPALLIAGWCYGRRGNHVVVALDAALTPTEQDAAILEALTVEEHAEYTRQQQGEVQPACVCA